MCLYHSGVCSWLLSCRGSVDPASLDILLTACVNSLSWNSFSKDDPPWGERGRHKAAAAVYLLFCFFIPCSPSSLKSPSLKIESGKVCLYNLIKYFHTAKTRAAEAGGSTVSGLAVQCRRAPGGRDVGPAHGASVGYLRVCCYKAATDATA